MVLAGQSDQPHHQRPRRWRGSEFPVESQLGRLLFNLSLSLPFGPWFFPSPPIHLQEQPRFLIMQIHLRTRKLNRKYSRFAELVCEMQLLTSSCTFVFIYHPSIIHSEIRPADGMKVKQIYGNITINGQLFSHISQILPMKWSKDEDGGPQRPPPPPCRRIPKGTSKF